jgi:small-conductance mechanosensitive channel
MEVKMIDSLLAFFSITFVRFVIYALIIYLSGTLIIRLINRKIQDLRRRHTWRKITRYTTVLLILAIAVLFWLEGVKQVGVVISIIGAGLVVALQDVILCFLGWVLIIFKRPFTVGDRIELGAVKGDVIDVRMFQTALLEVGNWVDADQSTGRVVHVPNSSVFRERVFNYTKGFEFIWNEIKITVTFESNWQKAKKIVLRHANPEIDKLALKVQESIKRMAKQYMIHYEVFTPIVYVSIVDHGVELTLRYLTDVRQRRSTKDRISQAILEDFAREEDINFAYHTTRLVK